VVRVEVASDDRGTESSGGAGVSLILRQGAGASARANSLDRSSGEWHCTHFNDEEKEPQEERSEEGKTMFFCQSAEFGTDASIVSNEW